MTLDYRDIAHRLFQLSSRVRVRRHCPINIIFTRTLTLLSKRIRDLSASTSVSNVKASPLFLCAGQDLTHRAGMYPSDTPVSNPTVNGSRQPLSRGFHSSTGCLLKPGFPLTQHVAHQAPSHQLDLEPITNHRTQSILQLVAHHRNRDVNLQHHTTNFSPCSKF